MSNKVTCFVLIVIACLNAGCSGESSSDTVSDEVITDTSTPDQDNTDDSANVCMSAFVDSTISAKISGLSDASASACVGPGLTVLNSLTNLEGIELTKTSWFSGEVSEVTPCIEAICDADYAYIATNSAQHWEYIAETPNADPYVAVYKIPLEVSEHNVSESQVETINLAHNCAAAYDQYLTDSTTGTSTSPSGVCLDTMDRDALSYFYIEEEGQQVPVAKLNCVGTNSVSVSGTPVHGSSEAAVPDPYGNPAYLYPDVGSEEYKGEIGGASYGQQGGSPLLDFCGAHSHHHGFNPVCFEKQNDNSPSYSHDEVRAVWDRNADLSQTSCSEESPIVAWMRDGTPVQGPCVCTERSNDGSCEELTYVRSSYVYDGIHNYGNDALESDLLSTDNMSCSTDSDCGSDDMKCNYTVVDDPLAIGGTAVAKRCTLIDYGWCSHPYINRAEQDMTNAEFIYADQCNGVETSDGYRYVSTASFPYHSACMRYATNGETYEESTR